MTVAAYLIVFGQATLLLYSDETVVWLGMEDSVIENIGALSFFLASVVFFIIAYRLSKLGRQPGTNRFERSLAPFFLGAFCFICFGEEISLGTTAV